MPEIYRMLLVQQEKIRRGSNRQLAIIAVGFGFAVWLASGSALGGLISAVVVGLCGLER